MKTWVPISFNDYMTIGIKTRNENLKSYSSNVSNKRKCLQIMFLILKSAIYVSSQLHVYRAKKRGGGIKDYVAKHYWQIHFIHNKHNERTTHVTTDQNT